MPVQSIINSNKLTIFCVKHPVIAKFIHKVCCVLFPPSIHQLYRFYFDQVYFGYGVLHDIFIVDYINIDFHNLDLDKIRSRLTSHYGIGFDSFIGLTFSNENQPG